MNIFEYLIFVGIVQLLYSFIIRWVLLVFSLVLVALKLDVLGMYLVKTINIYLYVSILSLITLYTINEQGSPILSLLIFAMGLFFAFITIGGGMYEGYKEASQNMNYDALRGMKYDTYFLFGSIIYFLIVILVAPSLATTLPVQILLDIIEWIYGLPVIGFLLGIFGVFSMLGTFLQVFIIGGAGIAYLIGKTKAKKVENPSTTTDNHLVEHNKSTYCTHCGKKIESHAAFCKHCGVKVSAS